MTDKKRTLNEMLKYNDSNNNTKSVNKRKKKLKIDNCIKTVKNKSNLPVRVVWDFKAVNLRKFNNECMFVYIVV